MPRPYKTKFVEFVEVIEFIEFIEFVESMEFIEIATARQVGPRNDRY